MSGAQRKLPSLAQAKLIASKWSCGESLKYGGYNSSTDRACVMRGWFETTGNTGHWPSGAPYAEYGVSVTGLLALECFLMDKRVNRK